MPTTSNVIDGYYGDPFDFQRLKDEGIVAIIHKATQGTDFKDPKYKERRDAAKGLGLLWGAFHFSTDADWEKQVDHFLNTAQPQPDELIAWDWEARKHGAPMTIGHGRDSVELINQKLGRYPVLYGGSVLREQVGHTNDVVLRNCPLWYARYRSAPIGIPSNTWSTYTLWQYTAGESPTPNPPGPVKAGGEFVDRNFYQGSDDDLRAKWPF